MSTQAESGGRDVDSESTATEHDAALGPRAPSRSRSVWQLTTWAAALAAGLIVAVMAARWSVPGRASVRHADLGSIVYAMAGTGCEIGYTPIGALHTADALACSRQCDAEPTCEFSLFGVEHDITPVKRSHFTFRPVASSTLTTGSSMTATVITETTVTTASATTASTTTRTQISKTTASSPTSTQTTVTTMTDTTVTTVTDTTLTTTKVTKTTVTTASVVTVVTTPPLDNCILGRGECVRMPQDGVVLTLANRPVPLATGATATSPLATGATATPLQATGVSCGKGCSNWQDILIDAIYDVDLAECGARCRASDDCADYNYESDACEGMPGAETCYLYRAGCSLEESPCWMLFTKEN